MTAPRSPTNQTDIALVFDFGERRIGVAVASTVAGTARELTTLPASDGEPDWVRLDELRREWRPGQFVCGLPYNADGSESAMTARARAFAARLGERYGLVVDMVDERLTSAEAESILRDQRAKGSRRRRTRKQDVDRLAARLIAESWLRDTGINNQTNDDC
ncbi:MAG: Holliday junction resolvase RuvX [Gammaproteobacteria bacterium]|nr:Holliday junction resolvase RuvX [Gammaproteobacteria bacterium]